MFSRNLHPSVPTCNLKYCTPNNKICNEVKLKSETFFVIIFYTCATGFHNQVYQATWLAGI